MTRCIPILAATIATTSIAAADALQLTNGDVVTGTIIEQNDESVQLEHPVLGLITIQRSQIASQTMGDVTATDVVIASTPAEQLPAAPPPDQATDAATPAEEKPKPEWKRNFTLALGASAGNTDTQDLFVGVKAVRERELTILALDASYEFGAESGDTTESAFTAGIRHDWLVPDSRWRYFVQGRYDFDEFQSWDHRASAHGGLGYELIMTEDFELLLRGGLGVLREWGSQEDDLQFEALLGADLRWDISEGQELTASSTLYPSLSDVGEFRVVSELAWRALIADENNMHVKVGLQHEYESEVDPGLSHHDLSVIAGLDFEF